jgi:hypothetical protein
MFECVVSRVLWDDIFKIFNILVTDFESIASKWLCNKKFIHFNLVSSTVLWTLWINRNNLIFNKRVNWFYATPKSTGCTYAITKTQLEEMPL